MDVDKLPNWFVDREIGGMRPLFILKKHGLSACDPFGQMVLIEFMAARQRGAIRSCWALFNRLVMMAAHGQPQPLGYSAEGEKIKERLARQGDL